MFESKIEAYLTCVYWCVATMTSTGYGDVIPYTIPEMWFSALVMLAGKSESPIFASFAVIAHKLSMRLL